MREAIREELSYFNKQVWELSDAQKVMGDKTAKTIRTRWVITNKGDDAAPDIRARLVATEVNTFKSDDFFASTPPLEAKRILFSTMASKRRDSTGRPLELSFVDVKKAYFNGVPRRRLYLFLPREMGQPGRAVAKLKRCVYGTRDAGLIWEECYSQALTAAGFKRGIASPCCFRHPSRQVSVVIHGDDFTALGAREDLLWYEDVLRNAFEIVPKRAPG